MSSWFYNETTSRKEQMKISSLTPLFLRKSGFEDLSREKKLNTIVVLKKERKKETKFLGENIFELVQICFTVELSLSYVDFFHFRKSLRRNLKKKKEKHRDERVDSFVFFIIFFWQDVAENCQVRRRESFDLELPERVPKLGTRARDYVASGRAGWGEVEVESMHRSNK